MRWTILLLAAALSACSLGNMATAPAGTPIAQSTKIDEQLALGVEAAYKVERLAIENAVDAGLVKGAVAVKLANIDRVAFEATQATRTAYAYAQTVSTPAASLSYVQAAQQATAAISAALVLLAQAGVR